MLEVILILLALSLLITKLKIFNLKQELEAMKREGEAEKKELSSLEEYNQKQTEIKNQRKDKLMAMFEKQEKVTNKNVVKELDISSVTAFRYLEELEQEGRIKQNKKLGRPVYYTKKD